MQYTSQQPPSGAAFLNRRGHTADMKQDAILSRWIADLSDEGLMVAFDQGLAEDEIPLVWRLADEIERRKLSI